MESVVQVVRGSQIDPKNQVCTFCGIEAVSMFCVTKETKYDGVLLSSFGICKEHLDRLNALLSGKFDIDDIYLEQYRVKQPKRVQLRRFPPVDIAPTKNKKSLKQCEFTGCVNKFHGIVNKKYCDDPRCKELRAEYFGSIVRTKLKDPDAKNLILSGPHYKRKLRSGQALKLRCRARNVLGMRCSNTYTITFDLKQRIYPEFCECHRSAYKRQRFYLQKG
jgi:hypothetical protein